MKTNQLAAAVAVVLGLAGFSGAASAQATGTITANVAVTFTAKCRVATSSSATVAIDFGAYTAFAADKTKSGTATYECSRGYTAAPAFAWDGDTTGADTVQGSVKGLRYALKASSTLANAGAAPSLTGTLTAGTPDTYDIKLDGTLFGGAGDPTGSATSSNTLVFTF